jgi:hypothetical protein
VIFVQARSAGSALAAAVVAVGGVGTVASSAAVAKVTLTVVTSGDGGVVSKPAGIACPSVCKLHVRKGTHVVLRATANEGSAFSHWSAPCGKSPTCKVTMSKSKSEHAFFKAQPSSTVPTPTPPPAPVGPKAGHYVGKYTDGSFFDFDVVGTSVTNVTFDFNGSCSDGSNLSDSGVTINGSFTIHSDGSFSGPITLDFGNASGSADLAGTVDTTGSANGTLKISVTFTSGGASCTSTGTWTAQDQS